MMVYTARHVTSGDDLVYSNRRYDPPNKLAAKARSGAALTNGELAELVADCLDDRAIELANVSEVTSMCWLFYNSIFKGDLSNWDVSNVEAMDCIFNGFKIENVLDGVLKWRPIELRGDITVISRQIAIINQLAVAPGWKAWNNMRQLNRI